MKYVRGAVLALKSTLKTQQPFQCTQVNSVDILDESATTGKPHRAATCETSPSASRVVRTRPDSTVRRPPRRASVNP
jgi:hypothetical protein